MGPLEGANCQKKPLLLLKVQIAVEKIQDVKESTDVGSHAKIR